MSESRGLTTDALATCQQHSVSNYEPVLEATLASQVFGDSLWTSDLMGWNYQHIPPSLSLPPRKELSLEPDGRWPALTGPQPGTGPRPRAALTGASLQQELGRHVQRLQRKDGQPVNLGRLWGNFNKRCSRHCFDQAVQEMTSHRY